ncbi:MAG: biopolymer transporter ExbD [Betaproteobacteria bacterium]|nr:biopolymer transporter ExbD [Betaproteobacteria bacterium]
MKFKTNTPPEPDINLIPFIDVLLVILIFLMLTTTWSKFNEMNLSLPTAHSQQTSAAPQTWVVSVNAQGIYAVNGAKLEGRTPQDIAAALSSMNKSDATLLIKADASASHQAVVNVLEAARMQGISKISFATQSASGNNMTKP